MVTARHLKVKDGDVLVLLGTSKGVFLLRSNASRKKWDLGGPYFPGHQIYALAFDGRAGRRRVWAGAQSGHFGAVLSASDDFGKSWTKPEKPNVRFPEKTGAALKQIWAIRPGLESQPGVLFCGVEPSALFVSRDAGESWELNQGLWDHPHRAKWEPGGGGLCMHTVVPDSSNPERLHIACSTGGHYRSDDGGKTWNACNRNIHAPFMPGNPAPEFGQCVHKLAQAAGDPKRFYLQHHWGVYRSDDGGDTWKAMEKGLPTTFGFALAAHPHDGDTAYVLPIESDGFRCTPEGKLRVYRTKDGGKSWKALTKGLPQSNALETVLRDGMDVDTCARPGVYFGTKSGKVYASADEGNSWKCIAEGLPTVNCVKAAVVPAAGKKRK